jgi:epidermal growth factor receptor substrate 15
LKKSGLSKDNLKLIWLISAQTDPQFLERDEFYIALRLIALAQNNMEVSEDSIRLNHPLPPMPKFDLKSSSQSTNTSSMTISNNVTNLSDIDSQPSNRTSMTNISIQEIDNYSLTEEDVKKYTALFNKNKDMDSKMSINKAFQMWSVAGVSNDTMKKILTIVPLSDKTCLTFSEFKVIFHLIYKSLQSDVPVTLPNSLKKVLAESVNNVTGAVNNSEINFGDKLGINMNMSGNSTNISSNIAPQMPINNNVINPPTNKSVDMEALLMSEFSLKQSSQNEPTKPVIPIIHTISEMNPPTSNNQVFQPNFVQQPPSQNQGFSPSWNPPAMSNVSPINSEMKKMNENLNMVLKDTTSENQFLNKVLDEDNSTLSSLLEEIERVTKTINLINEKNRMIRDQITDVRRKINTEQDNLAKINSTLNSKVNELMSNQGKNFF